MKLLCMLLWTLFCMGLALVPEALMYFTYSMIAPQSELAKIALVGLFWFVGGGFCIIAAYVGLIFWVFGVKAIGES